MSLLGRFTLDLILPSSGTSNTEKCGIDSIITFLYPKNLVLILYFESFRKVISNSLLLLQFVEKAMVLALLFFNTYTSMPLALHLLSTSSLNISIRALIIFPHMQFSAVSCPGIYRLSDQTTIQVFLFPVIVKQFDSVDRISDQSDLCGNPFISMMEIVHFPRPIDPNKSIGLFWIRFNKYKT